MHAPIYPQHTHKKTRQFHTCIKHKGKIHINTNNIFTHFYGDTITETDTQKQALLSSMSRQNGISLYLAIPNRMLHYKTSRHHNTRPLVQHGSLLLCVLWLLVCLCRGDKQVQECCWQGPGQAGDLEGQMEQPGAPGPVQETQAVRLTIDGNRAVRNIEGCITSFK